MKTNLSLLVKAKYAPSLSIPSNVAFVTTVVGSCWWLQLYEFRHGTSLQTPIKPKYDTTMKMKFHVFILIGVQISVFVSAKSSPWNDDDQNNFLREAGCGRSGKLLDIGVCTNYGYRPQITPRVQNSTMTNIYTTVKYQRVRDVNDKKGKVPTRNHVHFTYTTNISYIWIYFKLFSNRRD